MKSIATSYRQVVPIIAGNLNFDERKQIRTLLTSYLQSTHWDRKEVERYIVKKTDIATIIIQEVGLGKSAIVSFLLYDLIENGQLSTKEIDTAFDTQIEPIVNGLGKIKKLYKKKVSIETENFTNLLLSMAEDMRVILIITAIRLHTMRTLVAYTPQEQQLIARESSFLYAPLAHRMGLYSIKTELEDLSLKYINRTIYKDIAHKLNETKRSRDKYIAEFIAPLQERMKEVGFDFEIKGRTKSIHSIYNKIKKQDTAFENIYDLFAIRIIFDTPIDKEKSACWQAYSIVTDMYQPNPKRLRDWLSIPKSNGYESLHTTVIGPQGKWVEVQIRTERMNEIAEKGLAAHWRYKGVKGETAMDEWLKNLREILENPDLNAIDFMDEFKLNLYDKEVFVFTPNGDLHKLPKGATVLDFAFSIHTNLGTQCVGAKINNKHAQIKQPLQNGDQVEILTSPTQKPNASWLNTVVTTKARNKIRQTLKEIEYKDAEIGREVISRRFKNWKIDLYDGYISKLAKKEGYKTVSDFYQAIAQEKIDIHYLRDTYLQIEQREKKPTGEVRTAENFTQEQEPIPETLGSEDVLIIGNTLKNVEYTLSKCCNPVYGDKVFGFVSIQGGIKVHRTQCPNAPELISRYGYRIIKAEWSGQSVGSQYAITLQVVGKDDIGIVTNITSLITKEQNTILRSISIDSKAGIFEGNLTIIVDDNKQLEKIMKLIKNIKGVKNVNRL